MQTPPGAALSFACVKGRYLCYWFSCSFLGFIPVCHGNRAAAAEQEFVLFLRAGGVDLLHVKRNQLLGDMHVPHVRPVVIHHDRVFDLADHAAVDVCEHAAPLVRVLTYGVGVALCGCSCLVLCLGAVKVPDKFLFQLLHGVGIMLRRPGERPQLARCASLRIAEFQSAQNKLL